MKKILIFTDSRGQHIPAGYNHQIFANRFQEEVKDIEVELLLCPMKWTTTLDFLDYASNNDLSKYDYVVLHTGIVEWSPRPQLSAVNDLYNNKQVENLRNLSLNTRDYSKKIVNNKKKIFDHYFAEKNIKKYLSIPFETIYEGEATINMYSTEMANIIGRELQSFSNLIFINANRIVPNWEGDFKRGRPKNISIVHEYNDIVSSFIPKERLIDLREWTYNDIKNYTCDNMHLTDKGSAWIFDRLVKQLDLKLKNKMEIVVEKFEKDVSHDLDKLVNFKPLSRFVGGTKVKFLNNYNVKKLATLIIGVHFNEDSARNINLLFLLDWIEYYYEDLFDVLIVEQDVSSKFDKSLLNKYNFLRYEFIFNNEDYNRGWGYNVAVKHFCQDSKVVVMMDTDVLTGDNFVADVRDCLIGRYKVISPYQNIYYTDPEEMEKLMRTKNLSHLVNKKHIKNPVTLTGGVVIFDKKTYLELKGYEQYRGYCCEDRALDTMVFEFCNPESVKISPYAYIHLFHSTDKGARKNFKEIYGHLTENYKCIHSPELQKTDFIHRLCNHSDRKKLINVLIKKNFNFADVELYKTDSELTINGREKHKSPSIGSMILPPEFQGLKDYRERELYNAPEADIYELEEFRNAFIGERCFIIGNGSSLNKHDLALLENEFSFGVNSFYYKTKETGFTPTFYVVEDTSVMKENLQEIKNYYAPFKFFPTIYKRLHPKDPNTFFFTMNRGFYEKSSPNYCVPRFSTDATKELFCGQSVTYINLQLAYFMGFSEVYLIGMDFSYVIPDTHKRTGDVLLSDTDDENHFHKDYFGKGKTWKDPKLDRVAMNYRMAKLVFESTGRKVYNATVGGSLEIFERVDYNSLFGDKSSSEKTAHVLGSFADANKLFLDGRYSDALVIYLSLAESSQDVGIYQQSLFNCYVKVKESQQPLQTEVFERIKKFL